MCCDDELQRTTIHNFRNLQDTSQNYTSGNCKRRYTTTVQDYGFTTPLVCPYREMISLESWGHFWEFSFSAYTKRFDGLG